MDVTENYIDIFETQPPASFIKGDFLIEKRDPLSDKIIFKKKTVFSC